MIYYTESINGKVRENNEDSIAICTKPNFSYAIVADGMGGANAGEVASRTTVDCIGLYFDSNESRHINHIFLEEAVTFANNCVLEKIKNDSTLKGMGSTLTLACFDSKSIIVSQIGDSSAFLFDSEEKKLIKITKDHSYIQKLIDYGRITDEEARISPYKNIITRAIGVKNVSADFYDCHWKSNDILMLFSDGLTNSLNNKEILSIISSNKCLKDKGANLIDEALEIGGNDNISVILIENAEEE